MTVPTKEHKQFVQKLHSLKVENLSRMVQAAAIPPRAGTTVCAQEAHAYAHITICTI